MASQLSVVDLRCEGFTCALGLTEARPRLSWRLESKREGVRQIAYRVVASSSPAGFDVPELWDSGRVESNQSAWVEYGGAPLYSRERVYFRVEVEDESGVLTRSATSWVETGLLHKTDWRAQFISAPLAGGPLSSPPVPRFERAFEVDKPIKAARLYASALGVYRLELNGERVGDEELAPGWTDYRQTLRFQTFDVTERLRSGANTLSALLGDGWAVGHIGWKARQNFRDRPALLLQLEIEYADGERETLVSDQHWTCAFGPLLSSDLLQGEACDARLAWREVGPIEVAPLPADLDLRASLAPPVRATQQLSAIRVHQGASSQVFGRSWVLDFGQNLVGRVRLNFDGLGLPIEAGTTFRLRFAETLAGGPNDLSGPAYLDNLRSASQTDVYTHDGTSASWEPLFTFHGFRFLELCGWPGEEAPPLKLTTAVVLGTDLGRTGDFECSDPLINQLQKNIDWGWRGNSLDIPTDCPQRDERLGWTGDAQAFCETSLWNREAHGFWAEWARQVRDAQSPSGGIPCTVPTPDGHLAASKHADPWHDGGPAWSDAALICPWTVYRATGDTRVLSENYDVFTRYLDWLQGSAKDNLRCFDGCDYFPGFGDWLALDGSGRTEGGTPKELIGTAFYAHAADLLSRIAQVLGKNDDARRYAGLFDSIKQAFCARFVTPAGCLSPPFQTPYLLALEFDLVPVELRPKLAAELVGEIKRRGQKLSTGFVGSPYINGVLTREGHLDTAYALLHQTGWPSWLYAVTQGATTIWERWDGWTTERGFQDAGMNSFNHYAYGAIGAWLYSQVAGIALDPQVPGYARFVLAPKPGGELTFAKACLNTLHGRIESEWHLEDGHFNYRFVVPPNTSAKVSLPDGSRFEAVAGVWEGAVEMRRNNQ